MDIRGQTQVVATIAQALNLHTFTEGAAVEGGESVKILSPMQGNRGSIIIIG